MTSVEGNFQSIPTFSLEGYAGTARVLEVYDGDTIWIAAPLLIHFGVDQVFKTKVRLARVNTPELSDEKGITTKLAVIDMLLGSKASCPLSCECSRKDVRRLFEEYDCKINVRAVGADKYGRLLAEVYVSNYGDKNLSDWILEEGMSKPY
jgi:endonuclease YncB( thermonuclease family)